MRPQPFDIHIADEVLDDLRRRLRGTRWPDQPAGAGWDLGTDRAFLTELVDYWGDGFDWRAQERRINRFNNLRVRIDGVDLHCVHAPGREAGALPVLLLHGWPSSFVQMLDLAGLLAGDFEVVIASLPGYGFSSVPDRLGMGAARMGELLHRLMTEALGHARYAIRGSDFGESVMRQIATAHPAAVVGIHAAGPTPVLGAIPPGLTPDERRYVEAVRAWREQESGYAAVQATRPQTLAYGLNDSPAGLAAWIAEKFRRWSDCDGVLERRFTMDELLINITIYWVTGTINASMRLYGETRRDPPAPAAEVPAAFLVSSKDMVPAPRAWVERTHRVDRWTEVQRGGHFMEWEEPELVAGDMRAFFRGLRDGGGRP